MIRLRSISHEISPNTSILLTNIEEYFPSPLVSWELDYAREREGFHVHEREVFLLKPTLDQLFFLHPHCSEEFVV